MPNPVQRVIVRRVDNLGDIVIALPTLQALRKNYPAAEITLMVKDVHRTLCREVADSFLSPTSSEEFAEIARAYDLAFNIEYFGPGNRMKQMFRRDGGVNQVNAVPGPRRRPMARHLLDGLAVLGLAVPRSAEPKFRISPELRKQVTAWLRSSEVSGHRTPWVGIHLGSSAREKRWPTEKFMALSAWLHRSFDAHLFFFGTSTEASSISAIRNSFPTGCAVAIVDRPLDFVAGVLARMDLLIGNDSGVGHLASAVGTPTVSIFGPTAPALWRPAGAQAVVVHKDRRGNVHARGPSLSVEQVKQGVLLCIQQHLRRERFPVLDSLRVSRGLSFTRVADGVIVRSKKRGPACMVTDGWRRVKQILAFVEEHGSYRETLEHFTDATPLLGLFILHGIILQGSTSKKNSKELKI
ncbi:MAG TPA: glycosyltransferase family 9 protein [Candidatus Kapabacteria bacterium]|nr:glycosyltransferase family 9 protein [Candidatus Kapabacteria bacterium]